MYSCRLETGEVELAFRNTEQNADVTRMTEFAGTIVISDRTAHQVKMYDSVDNTVSVLLGSGREGQLDGTQQSCTFIQVQGICSIEKILLVTDVAAGKINIVSGLSGTEKFLKMLGSLFDTFGIHAKGHSTKKTTLEQAKQNVTEIHEYMQTTVAKVKERRNLNPRSATSGPEGTFTVSNKTQQLLELLKKGLCRLTDNVKCINPQYFENVNLATLLTTQVENLHAVSHFKHETPTGPAEGEDLPPPPPLF